MERQDKGNTVSLRGLKKGTEDRVTMVTGATHNVSFLEHQTIYLKIWEAKTQSKILALSWCKQNPGSRGTPQHQDRVSPRMQLETQLQESVSDS